jgi:hypothetical protein
MDDWGLTQSCVKNANYHGAIDTGSLRHKPRTVLCFVQTLRRLNGLGYRVTDSRKNALT